MTWNPIGTYVSGTSVLHRLPPGVKLSLLLATAVALMWVRTWWMSAAALTAVILLTALARLPFRDLLRTLRGFALVAVLLFAFQTWQRGTEFAFTIVGSLLALIIASHLVTQTTRSDDMVASLTTILGPLRPLGVHPERVALAFSLTLRAIPSLFVIAHETREAAQARGLERNLRAYTAPLVIRSVRYAQLLGEGLEARGLNDD